MNILKLLLFSTFTLSVLWGQNLKDEVKELTTIHKKIQREYWDLKQKNLQAREEIKEQIDNLDSILKTRYEKRNSLTEETFLVQENLNQARQKLEEVQSINNTFKTLLFETIANETDNVITFYPKMIEPSTQRLNKIKATLEIDSLKTVELIIDYKRNLIQEGEKIVIYRTKLLNKSKNVAEDVNVLRIGFIHSSFSGNDFSGILLRETGLSGIQYKWNEGLTSKKNSEVIAGVEQSFNQIGKKGNINVPIDIMQSGNRLRSFVEDKQSGIWQRVVSFFIAGGIVMYPLLMVALLAFYICCERLIYFWQFRRKKLLFLTEIKSILEKKKDTLVVNLIKKKGNPLLINLLVSFFEKRPNNRTQAELHLQDRFEIYLPEIEKGLSGLAVLSVVSPLLGLLGTVTGMIELFDVITLYGTGNPKILASGISVALITTQTGLTIAVPLILMHHFFVRWKTRLTDSLDAFAIDIINICYPNDSQNKTKSNNLSEDTHQNDLSSTLSSREKNITR